MRNSNYFLFLCLCLISPTAVNADWSTNVTEDVMTDEQKGFATLIGSVNITARCYASGPVDVVVNWKEYLTNQNSYPLDVRVGDESMLSFKTTINTDGNAQFIKKTGAFISELMKEKKIKLQTKNFRGTSTRVAVVDAAGFRASWKEACGWHYKYNEDKGYVYRKHPDVVRKEVNAKKLQVSRKEQSSEQVEQLNNRLSDQEKRQSLQLQKRYFDAIRQRVKRNFRRPPGLSPEAQCVVSIVQAQGGEIVDVNVEQCYGGNVSLERSVERAVLLSSPLPLPPRPEMFDRQLRFRFRPL